MFDLFAAIQPVDPPSLILWSLLAFAAGIYPVGLMLGSTCSPCCGTPCTQCTQGSLPDTVTVTFSGFANQTSTNVKTCCGDYYNGMTVVLRRDIAFSPCVYRHSLCGLQRPGGQVGSADAEGLATITLSYRGPSLPPLLSLVDGGPVTCSATLTATQNITDCSDFAFVMTNASGITAQVVPGGTYDAAFLNPGGHACYICCKGEEPFASEAEFTIQDNRGSGTNASGTYVVPFRQYRGNAFIEGWGAWEQGFTVSGSAVYISVQLRTCGSQFENRPGWTPYTIGFSGITPVYCDECHNKCHFSVTVGFDNSSFWNDQSQYTADCASECQETPICDPYGRTWGLCSSPTDCGGVVVTA